MTPALRLRWRQALRRLGPSGLAALPLLAAALVLAAATPPLSRRAEQLAQALARRGAAATRPAPALDGPPPLARQISGFVASFPPLAQSSSDLDAVFQSAGRHQVQLLKGEYQLKNDPGAPLLTYSAAFPVHADYAALREFSADVLRALPHASMDELRMARSDAGSVALDSVVRFTFVYRSR
jgi:hypothetical protein